MYLHSIYLVTTVCCHSSIVDAPHQFCFASGIIFYLHLLIVLKVPVLVLFGKFYIAPPFSNKFDSTTIIIAMPNYLKSNAIVWHHFIKETHEKRGKCIHCGQSISYEKSTLSNLRRHLTRRHGEIMELDMDSRNKPERTHYVWYHFMKEPEEKAKCVYCFAVIACPKNVVSNLIRHLRTKHPTLTIETDPERDQEPMYESSRSQYIRVSIEESLNASASLQELELEMDSDLLPTEVQPIQQMQPSSVKIEVVDSYSESRSDDADQEVIEEEILHESQDEVESDCEVIEPSSSYEEHHQQQQETVLPQMVEQTITNVSSASNSTPQVEKMERSSSGQENFFSIGMNDINMKTAVYATNVAMELESLSPRQSIFAQKLMADVMFHAKLDNLTEYAMIFGKAARPFDN